ncbi:MAG: hypothetical protein LWX51_16025 [Deltaproteobacteria bacterium]|jgi:hypothetical protein|nr:hypothetical protein [Deltaproteobacteria bacterium]
MKTLRTNWLVLLAALVILAAGHSAALAYTVNGHAECTMAGWAPYGAMVKVFEIDPLPGGSYTVDPTPLATTTVDENGNFTAIFSWPSGGAGYEVGGPDLILQFTQNINSSFETIYEENPSEAHWNVADGATLTFEISSPLAVCLNPDIDLSSIPNNKLFLFIRVGNCKTSDIDCKGSVIGSEGYYRPRKAPYSFTGMDTTDQPFGRTLHLFGWFGKLCTIDYYKVQYSTDGGTTWTDIETSLPNKWYDTSDPNPLNWHWVSESMGPFSDGGLDNLYKVPFFVRPDTPWSWLDRVARFNTTLATDGLCRLKIIGYKWSGSSLVEATSSDILVDPNYGEIVLQIDNTPPTVNILDVKLNGVSKPVCDILNFGISATDEISVSFRVWDQRGHLRNYVLDAMYGHDCYVKPRPTTPDKASDNYENNASGSPSWQGNLSYTTEYIGSDYGSGGASPSTDCFSKTFAQMPANVMPTCAYQFRLHASKRTTNGYGLIYHWVEDTWHVTIQR